MNLTEKDKQFIERLKDLVEQRILWIDRVAATPGYFVLRGNYGDHIAQRFGMTRQGVRWRFWRLFNDIYISAYTTIIFVERHFGSGLRQDALQIAQQRFNLRQEMLKDPFFREANEYRGKDQD